MSYCKINIRGKERGLKFNQIAILEIGERNEKCKFERGSLQYEFYSTVSILFAGLRGCAFAKDEEEDFKWEDCVEWAENLSSEDKLKMIEALTSSEKYKETTAYKLEEEKTDKKKESRSPSKSTKRRATK